jgi:hypothetical protein
MAGGYKACAQNMLKMFIEMVPECVTEQNPKSPLRSIVEALLPCRSTLRHRQSYWPESDAFTSEFEGVSPERLEYAMDALRAVLLFLSPHGYQIVKDGLSAELTMAGKHAHCGHSSEDRCCRCS